MARVNNPGRTFAAYSDRASPNVRELQQVLRRMELYVGEITGHFDDATYQAYRQACDEAQRRVSRDKKGRLIVTLEDFEALEQRARGRRGYQKPVRTQAAPQKDSAMQPEPASGQEDMPEDDYAKRPVLPLEAEEDSAKRPVIVPIRKPVRRHWWVNLLAVLCLVMGVGVVYLATRSMDEPAAPPSTKSSDSYKLTTIPDAPVATVAPTSNPQDFKISITGNKTCSITGYTGNDTQLEIPSTIQGYTVTAIGDKAFYSCYSLTSITIPDSITTIGNSAFSQCSSLTSITIPGSVRVIGNSAFSRCTSLPSLTIPDSVTYIRDFAFSNCDSLTSITIPDSVTTIGTNPFSGCDNLTDIIVSPNNPTLETIDGVLYNKVKKTLICYPCAYVDSSYAIPQGIRAIGDSAFVDCTSLTSITIPNSVTAIGNHAFRDCTSLPSITIPDSVTDIGYYAFSWCTSLTSITIPDSVTVIGDEAFSRCTSLPSITIPDSVAAIGHRAFLSCDALTSIYVTENSYAHQYCIDNNLPYVLQ